MWYLTLRQPTKPRDQWTVTLGPASSVDETAASGWQDTIFGPHHRSEVRRLRDSRRDLKTKRKRLPAAIHTLRRVFAAFELYEWEVHQIMGGGPFTAAEIAGASVKGKSNGSEYGSMRMMS